MGDGELPSRARGQSGQGRAGAREAHLRPGQQRERPGIFWAPAGLRKKKGEEGCAPREGWGRTPCWMGAEHHGKKKPSSLLLA